MASKTSLSSYLFKEFLLQPQIVANSGCFDLDLNEESLLYFDIFNTKNTETKEFKNAFEKFGKYFSLISDLLRADKEKIAITYLKFPELNGLKLGYSEGKKGSGLGPKFALQLLTSAKELIKIDKESPEIFLLIPFIESNIGCDRISDLMCRILIENIINYTNNTFDEKFGLKGKIKTKKFTFKIFDPELLKSDKSPFTSKEYELPINPYDDSCPILLLPKGYLAELPVSYDYSDISYVSHVNDTLREKINNLIRPLLRDNKKRITKDQIKQVLLSNQDIIKEILTDIKESRWNYEILEKEFIAFISPIALDAKSPSASIRDQVETILQKFKDIVENSGGWKNFYFKDKPLPEAYCQRLFYFFARAICDQNKLLIYPEVDLGCGKVDFMFIAQSIEKVIVEIKLSNHARIVHGYEKQIEAYMLADKPDFAYFLHGVVTDATDTPMTTRLGKLAKSVKANTNAKKLYFEFDASQRESASKK